MRDMNGHQYGHAEDGHYGSNSRSHSASRGVSGGIASSNNKHVSQMSQRERAMASVQTSAPSKGHSTSGRRSPSNSNIKQQPQQQQSYPTRYRTSPTPSQKSSARIKTLRSSPTPMSQNQHQSVTNKENNYRESPSRQQPQNQHSAKNTTRSSSSRQNKHPEQPQSQSQSQSQKQQTQPQQNQVIVTPELLVDALSGQEDGLLAIAERLMEHYDAGYDAMGEAIIDAFADVQKLFQHVVEAAHMEGAAYEAGRREEEIDRLKRALGGENVDLNLSGNHGGGGTTPGGGDYTGENQHAISSPHTNGGGNGNPNSASSPMRHEEFVDQDVRDVLIDAIRKGQTLKESQKFAECYQLFEHACNSASSLLPVDSDHRGRLQLSIARAESMTAERACAILKYVMDDVLRSGLTSNSKVVMPDPSQRGDCVLSRPPPKTKIIDDSPLNSKYNGTAIAGGEDVVLQSSEEALASMVEEMKEIMGAPVYDNSPLQSVADRFWSALGEAQRNGTKTEERLEQKLGELKGDFLMAQMVR